MQNLEQDMNMLSGNTPDASSSSDKKSEAAFSMDSDSFINPADISKILSLADEVTTHGT